MYRTECASKKKSIHFGQSYYTNYTIDTARVLYSSGNSQSRTLLSFHGLQTSRFFAKSFEFCVISKYSRQRCCSNFRGPQNKPFTLITLYSTPLLLVFSLFQDFLAIVSNSSIANSSSDCRFNIRSFNAIRSHLLLFIRYLCVQCHSNFSTSKDFFAIYLYYRFFFIFFFPFYKPSSKITVV